MLLFGFLFLLAMLYLGSRYGGVGLGIIAGIGLMVEVFIFRMPLGHPAIEVMLVIMAVVACASVLEAAGGLKYILQIAERLLRNNPTRITFLGPMTTYCMSLMLGTAHATYSLMPIICDIALKNNIRPERPMAAASMTAKLCVTASPLSAITALYLRDLEAIDPSITLFSIILITIPSTFIASLLISLYSVYRGKDLDKDPEYQERLKNPEFRSMIEKNTSSVLGDVIPVTAKYAVWLFLVAIAFIVLVAMVPIIRTIGDAPKPIAMVHVIQMVMLGFAGIILLVSKVDCKKIATGVVFKAGMVATVTIFGIAWMSDTYLQYAMPVFKTGITTMVQSYPWTFALAVVLASILVNSQAATAAIMLPVGIGLGLDPALLIALIPACYAYFVFPVYALDVATMNFDITGTTRVGKYYFNHSFIVPGFIGLISSCVVGYILAQVLI